MVVAERARSRPALLRWAVATYLTIRVSALGFTLVLPLVGAASAAAGRDATRVAAEVDIPMGALMLVALSFHVFAYVLNDVVDLWLDRSEPLRADSPLVQGAIGRAGLLLLAWAQVPVAFGLALLRGAHGAAMAMLLAAFAAMAVYDLYGKRCRWPLLTDAVQSVGWCALVGVGAWWHGPVWPTFTGWIVAYVFCCVMLVQGVHGGLRDLANDLRGGARTTAVWLEARPGAGSGIEVSGPVAAYAVLLQAGLWITSLAALHSALHDAQSAASAGLVMAALTAATGALVLAYRRRADRSRLIGAGAWNIVCTLLVLPTLVLPVLSFAGACTLLAALLLPIAAMLVYNGSHWRLAQPPPARGAR